MDFNWFEDHLTQLDQSQQQSYNLLIYCHWCYNLTGTTAGSLIGSNRFLQIKTNFLELQIF